MTELPIGISGGGTGAVVSSTARSNLGIDDPSAASSLGGVAGFAGFRNAYRIPLSSGSGGADGYQLKLVIGESSGSSGVDFHVDEQSQTFPSAENVGGDFKFVKADGNAVPFFVERVTGVTPNRTVVIWVALPNGTAADIIFLLTNNILGIANQSDSGSVFPSFYDSFDGSVLDTSKWTALNSTGLTVGSGSMRHTNNSARIRSNATFSAGNIVLEVLWNGPARSTNGHTIGGFGNAASLASDAIGYLWHPSTDYVRNNNSWVAQNVVTPTSTELLLRMVPTTNVFFNFVSIVHENYDTGAQLYSRVFGNLVSNENIFIGQRFDSSSTGQALDIFWRWVRIRQQGTAPDIGTVTEV